MTIAELIAALQALPDHSRLVKVYDTDEALMVQPGMRYIVAIDARPSYTSSIFLDVSSAAPVNGL